MTTPIASYRLQLTPDFGFGRASALLPTLRRLGVSHLYLSPVAEAVEGSGHGYDVTDHTRVRGEFGGDAGLERLLDSATEHELGVIVDHVPNHVSIARPESNPMWWRLLTEGPGSSAAAFFDVDWQAAGGKVVVPQLGSPLEELIERDEIRLTAGPDGGEITIGSQRFPLRAGTDVTHYTDVSEALTAQHYRLQWWREPFRNVRRFFTIDDLVAVRVEEPWVGEHVDTIPRRLVDHPAFSGVRVDHIDGLADPTAYLERLRGLLGDRLLLVEKILAPGEWLPQSWPVDGTTGYEHITAAEHALLDPASREPLMRAWSAVADETSFEELERTGRREVIDGGLRPDVDRLLRVVTHAEHVDVDESTTREAIVLLTLELERYRTYLPDPESGPVFDELVRSVVDRCDDEMGHEVQRVARVLSGGNEARRRWQQLTGPVMAKGAEDRAFYRYFPLASLCEVGGAPGMFELSVDGFHRHQAEMAERAPAGMLASTTHDTKRSEGVRARSLALAAHAATWERSFATWMTDHETTAAGIDRRFVSLALQTALTARPLSVERLHAFLVKAAREGDEITSWIEPDDTVEASLWRLSEAAVETTERGALAEFADTIESDGDDIGLRLLALHLTCPGFPDLYQGSPTTLLSLVDPDNRRPPSWATLTRLIDDAAASDAPDVDTAPVDLARTVMTRRVLDLRRRRPASFDERSAYLPLRVSGRDADRAIAYARSETEGDGRVPTVVVIVIGAGAVPIGASDPLVELPAGEWRSVLHDDDRDVASGPTPLAELISTAGVAVLESTDR